jgi:hypothetical protein
MPTPRTSQRVELGAMPPNYWSRLVWVRSGDKSPADRLSRCSGSFRSTAPMRWIQSLRSTGATGATNR